MPTDSRSITFKRRYPRVEFATPILVKRVGESAPEQMTRTQVLGLGGCMFLSGRTFGPNALLALMLTVRGRVLRAKARVAYERRRPQNEIEVGVEFLHLDALDTALLESVVPAGTGRAN
ncbi:MAG: PilZ domain-containing protein [Acidobacteriota bacterium]